MKRLIEDVHALDRLIAEGRIESAMRRMGAYREVLLADVLALLEDRHDT